MDTRYPKASLEKFAYELLIKSGLAPAPARDVAEILVAGDLLGKSTHGLQLLAPYLQNLAQGKMTRTGRSKILKKSATTLLLDGLYLPGPYVVRRALHWAIPRAKKHGVATVSIRRSHHIACLQAYLQSVTDQGLIVLLMCSDPAIASVAPPGGVQAVCSPNPIAVGIPTRGDPILIDTTTASTTNGLMARMYKEQRKLSAPFLQTARGQPSNKPAILFAKPPGTILPLGGLELGHKGFAFAIMVEALANALAGHGRADKPTRWGASVLLQIFNPKFFGGVSAFTRETTFFAETTRQSKKRPGVKKIRLPGDDALALQRQQSKHGIALHSAILPALEPWTKKLKVKLPTRQ